MVAHTIIEHDFDVFISFCSLDGRDSFYPMDNIYPGDTRLTQSDSNGSDHLDSMRNTIILNTISDIQGTCTPLPLFSPSRT